MKGLKQKKAHLMEINVNGGTIAQKVDYAYNLFEKQVPVDAVFQDEYHHRTEMNKKVYKLGKAGAESHTAITEFDRTEKDITPMGGFPHYGVVKDDYLMRSRDAVSGLRRELLPFAISCLIKLLDYTGGADVIWEAQGLEAMIGNLIDWLYDGRKPSKFQWFYRFSSRAPVACVDAVNMICAAIRLTE